jgi:hypothetical protein
MKKETVTDESRITLLLTERELTMIGYAVESFHAMSARAPLIVGEVSRHDAMTARRELDRFHARIRSLLKGYGITL